MGQQKGLDAVVACKVRHVGYDRRSSENVSEVMFTYYVSEVMFTYSLAAQKNSFSSKKLLQEAETDGTAERCGYHCGLFDATLNKV